MTTPNVTVTAASTSETLCLRADVKTALDIASTDTSHDARLDFLIRAASLAIQEQGLGRPPWLQTYLERLPGDGGRYLFVSRWPIQTITSITIGTGDSPTTITATDYSVAGRHRDRVYKPGEWNLTAFDNPVGTVFQAERDLEYNVTYAAGWAMPDEVTEWSASQAVASGEWYKSTDADEAVIFQAGGAGTTDSAEPTWNIEIGDTTTDNDITWTAHQQRLPEQLELAAQVQVMEWFRGGLEVPSGIAEEAFGGGRIRYREAASVGGLSPAVQALCGAWR